MKIIRIFFQNYLRSLRSCIAGRLPLFLFAVSILLPCGADASMPVERTLTGCVIHTTFYSVYPVQEKPLKAYRISVPDSINLSRFEGKTISVDGFLAPGDRFYLRDGARPVVVKETCSADYRKVINREVMIAYTVGALRAADRKDFKEADGLMAKALQLDENDCQTYIDRAFIYYVRGDSQSGRRDAKRVLDRQCPDRSRLNFLILGDVAKILLRNGKKQEAEEIYRLALETCQSSICRESVQSDLKRLKGPANQGKQ
jgi:hypothetical protein